MYCLVDRRRLPGARFAGPFFCVFCACVKCALACRLYLRSNKAGCSFGCAVACGFGDRYAAVLSDKCTDHFVWHTASLHCDVVAFRARLCFDVFLCVFVFQDTFKGASGCHANKTDALLFDVRVVADASRMFVDGGAIWW